VVGAGVTIITNYVTVTTILTNIEPLLVTNTLTVTLKQFVTNSVPMQSPTWQVIDSWPNVTPNAARTVRDKMIQGGWLRP